MILRFEARVNAPIERCFDLSRNISLHTTLKPWHEAVSGITSGLIGKGETVTWRARILGVPITHTSLIDEYDRPIYFRDVMVKGAFKSYQHQHYLEQQGDTTILRDVVTVFAPLGFLGRIAEGVYIRGFLEQILASRNKELKRVAESNEWKKYLSG
jgi:ligand-binding SRPBCC domain-containing protein